MNLRIWQAITLSTIIFLGCSDKTKEKKADNQTAEQSKPIVSTPVPAEDDNEPPPPPPEGRKIHGYQDGKMTEMFESEAKKAGLTVIDLSNYWVPFIFSERDTPDGPRLKNEFRPIFRKLANDWPYESRTMAAAHQVYDRHKRRSISAKIAALREEGVSEEDIKERLGLKNKKDTDDSSEEDDTAPKDTSQSEEESPEDSGAGDSDHYLEVYGIPPSLSVLRKRAIEELQRECLDEIDLTRIQNFDGFVAYQTNDRAKAEAKKGRTFAKKMRAEMEKLGVTDAFTLLDHPDNKMSKGLIKIATKYEALAEAQKQLVCEKLFKDENAEQHYVKGGLDWKTHQALTAFERKNRIFGWGFFGRDTLAALRKSPKERLFDSFMRVIAERVIDTVGVIEDGSAKNPDGSNATYKDENGKVHEVGNLVAEYTATILKEMNLGTPDKVIEFLQSFKDSDLDQLYVAVRLPALPPYYSEEMELHSVINRGDVWYEYPYTLDGKTRGQPRKRMPLNTLYVKWNDQDIPLATMNTTIGSWRTEQASDGYEYYKYKNSDVGPRVWKDIVAGPVWLPPDTAPGKDMIKTVRYKGRTIKVPNYDEFGPWYASAYGLVAAFHVRQVETKSGEYRYLDNGIRSHGSVDYNSILRRFSHGCHRLYNHQAIRLFDFVLRHKKFNRIGQISAGFSKKVEMDEESFVITLDSRGYKYELLDPVPVMVQKGYIRGKQKTPIETYMPKPETEYGEDAQFVPEEWRKAMEEDTDGDAGVESLPQEDSPSSSIENSTSSAPSTSEGETKKTAPLPSSVKREAATN